MRRGASGVFEHGVEIARGDLAFSYRALALRHSQRQPASRAQAQLFRPLAQALRQGKHVRAHIKRQQRRRVFKAFTVSHVDNLFALRPA